MRTSVFVPFVDTTTHDFEPTINTSATLSFALKHWDFYAYGSIGDVGSIRLPSVGGGVVLRWATEN
jgi:hypothetical protein